MSMFFVWRSIRNFLTPSTIPPLLGGTPSTNIPSIRKLELTGTATRTFSLTGEAVYITRLTGTTLRLMYGTGILRQVREQGSVLKVLGSILFKRTT